MFFLKEEKRNQYSAQTARTAGNLSKVPDPPKSLLLTWGFTIKKKNVLGNKSQS